MSIRMVRKRRAGDKAVIHTPSEIVRCEFDGGIVIANCTGTNARRVLEKKGFVIVPEASEPPVKYTRARNEDGHFKADDQSTPDVNEAWKPPKKKSAKKPVKKK